MAWTKESACGALAKGWRKMGWSAEKREKAHAKCLRNYKAPRKVKRRGK